MGYRRDLFIACKDKDRVIGKINVQLNQLQDENKKLQINLEQERHTAAAEMELAVCRKNSISMEKEETDKKLANVEKVVRELQEEHLSQTNQIRKIEQEVQMQRPTIWGVVSLFVAAAASFVFAVSRR